MATATARRTWTEAEIRESIETPIRDAAKGIYELLGERNALDPIVDSDQALSRRGWQEGFYPQEGHPGTLWADLTEAEAEDLSATMDEAIDFIALGDFITDGVVRAAMEWAARHPAASLGHWRPAGER